MESIASEFLEVRPEYSWWPRPSERKSDVSKRIADFWKSHLPIRQFLVLNCLDDDFGWTEPIFQFRQITELVNLTFESSDGCDSGQRLSRIDHERGGWRVVALMVRAPIHDWGRDTVKAFHELNQVFADHGIVTGEWNSTFETKRDFIHRFQSQLHQMFEQVVVFGRGDAPTPPRDVRKDDDYDTLVEAGFSEQEIKIKKYIDEQMSKLFEALNPNNTNRKDSEYK